MGADLGALIRAVLSDPEERRDFVASFFVLILGFAAVMALVFMVGGALGA